MVCLLNSCLYVMFRSCFESLASVVSIKLVRSAHCGAPRIAAQRTYMGSCRKNDWQFSNPRIDTALTDSETDDDTATGRRTGGPRTDYHTDRIPRCKKLIYRPVLQNWMTIVGYQIFVRITRFVILVIRPDYREFCLRSTPDHH